MLKTATYFGCRVRQRADLSAPQFFLFFARVKDVMRWAGIRRVAETPRGTQRLLRKPRAMAVARFLGASPRNTLPTGILLAFGSGTASFTPVPAKQLPKGGVDNGCDDQIAWGFLSFQFDPESSEHERPALIVDGQHRLHGAAAFLPESVPVFVVAELDAPLEEQAFQFIVINNKAVRVPTDDAKAIIADLDEESLRDRLLGAGVRYGGISPILKELNEIDRSPFKGKLRWAVTREGEKVVQLTAVEESLRYWRVQFPFLEEDEDSLLEAFMATWRGIRARFVDAWQEAHRFMKKVCLTAMNEFVADRVKFGWELDLIDVLDPSKVEEYAFKSVEGVPIDLWTREWTIHIQDNANVRSLIKEALGRVLQNTKLKRPWDHEVDLVQQATFNPDEKGN